MSDKPARPGFQPATQYPDPAIHALDPRFEKYWLKPSAVERLTTGLRWAKALVWFGYGRYLPAALFRPTPGPNMKTRSCEGVSNCP